MVNKLGQYLEEIRESDGLKNAILCGITVYKRGCVAEFFLMTDKTYTSLEEKRAKEISQKYLPSGFSAAVRLVKRVPDAPIIKNRIFEGNAVFNSNFIIQIIIWQKRNLFTIMNRF